MSDQDSQNDDVTANPSDLSDDKAMETLKPEAADDVPAPIDTNNLSDGYSETEALARPIDVPEKFWDSSTNTVRTDALLKSYRQLEKKLGAMVPLPTADDPESHRRLQRVLGRPDSPEDYQIEAPHELLVSDPDINSKLHEAGFTPEQAQLVYNLAAEHMLPVVEQMNADASQDRELAQLTAHFGGDQAWQALAPQIRSWAEANLNEEVYKTLGSSFDGIVAMHHMMQNREPSLISEATVPSNEIDKDTLNQMMRDPRYWRDHDPAFVNRVTEGYKRLYG